MDSLNGMSVGAANRLFRWGVSRGKTGQWCARPGRFGTSARCIEVGYGLGGVPCRTGDDFTPRKDGDYSGGIRNGVTHLVEIVERHQVLTPEEIAKLSESRAIPRCRLIVIPISVSSSRLGSGCSAWARRLIFTILFGSLFGGVPLLMSMAPMGRCRCIRSCVGVPRAHQAYHLGGRDKWKNAFRDAGRQWLVGNWLDNGRELKWFSGSKRFGGSSRRLEADLRAEAA